MSSLYAMLIHIVAYKAMQRLLHCIVRRYAHGSAEADARVKRLGYCRVHMPSIPRAGSTWFREMFEVS
jgi:hypothetical protein